ncbi:hypothetical protein PZ897_02135 [Hoeflea sp. YIM 152468]|uniref:hypothetical protein n=1 Tax=Hoeflea sp. YIM 152468 TaxID=3031759 RepID=UPI0023DC0D09|nr:hypothetical protein [Hoeflea sp. YIM 152468]MDF1606970.1 hypothetical protein [Hoeflea sp. YIM 152468]
MTGLQNGRNPKMADYDWRRFAHELSMKHRSDGRGLRAIATEMGVTASDLSRAMGGQIVSVQKVIAICKWIGFGVMDFYLPPLIKTTKSTCCSGSNVKHREDEEPRGLGHSPRDLQLMRRMGR